MWITENSPKKTEFRTSVHDAGTILMDALASRRLYAPPTRKVAPVSSALTSPAKWGWRASTTSQHLLPYHISKETMVSRAHQHENQDHNTNPMSCADVASLVFQNGLVMRGWPWPSPRFYPADTQQTQKAAGYSQNCTFGSSISLLQSLVTLVW